MIRIKINLGQLLQTLFHWTFHSAVNGSLAWWIYRNLHRGNYSFGVALAFFWIMCSIDRVFDKLTEVR